MQEIVTRFRPCLRLGESYIQVLYYSVLGQNELKRYDLFNGKEADRALLAA